MQHLMAIAFVGSVALIAMKAVGEEGTAITPDVSEPVLLEGHWAIDPNQPIDNYHRPGDVLVILLNCMSYNGRGRVPCAVLRRLGISRGTTQNIHYAEFVRERRPGSYTVYFQSEPFVPHAARLASGTLTIFNCAQAGQACSHWTWTRIGGWETLPSN